MYVGEIHICVHPPCAEMDGPTHRDEAPVHDWFSRTLFLRRENFRGLYVQQISYICAYRYIQYASK